ncbi:hypothetical protein FDK31_02020 [Citrobacter werkmanii]|nr:hypothetical protein [Citrobacter werkmanii]MBQ4934312.1 hypothetical protein [Citrobacter werkmanii]MBQ4947244.1 hypothetical protein [Citrobacter werkmanii]
MLVSLFYLSLLCDIHHKKESTPQFLTNQYFFDLNHEIIKLLFIYIFPETKRKKSQPGNQTGLVFSSRCYIAFLVNSITRSFAIALASSADA